MAFENENKDFNGANGFHRFITFNIKFRFSAPVEDESNTDLPAEGEPGWQDKFKSVTSNAKRYFGLFMNKMESDLWLSVGITFVSVFVLCSLTYVLLTSVRFFSRCCRC
ncbi:hypothetical protein CDAR_226341 [Caerostris darwini]|uniref:Uncharacterized protein n=1 Tax=Caerostris darwini TaxID=1538125 RepID=A0AAV4ULN7_9ARAC|nr:hypothetical protein CDAR_226341 [Caerostris darwini]